MIRLRAGISYASIEAMDEGHCGLPTDQLIPLAEELLEAPKELILTALELKRSEGAAIADKVGDTACMFMSAAVLRSIQCRTQAWGNAMTGEDLRRKNASLRDRIEQVLEMHPELRDEAEAIALSQDLHVEFGAPFLERTRDKLQERARAIIEHRPELKHYFDDFAPAKAVSGHNSREAQLEAALVANAALRIEAEGLIAAYIAPESDRPAIINALIALFDGPAQREARTLAAEALG
jgi:hypothetical protein